MNARSRLWLIGLLSVSLAVWGCGQEKEQKIVEPRPGDVTHIPLEQPRKEIDPLSVLAVIETEKGTMEMEFLPGAPKTAKHITELIEKRFYNENVFKMRFFRVDDDVIQTGDPTNTGTEGSSQNIDLEVWEGQDFRVGSVGIAHSDDDPNSGNSQFFICKQDLPHLNKDYTLFGQVISGLDVLQKIEKDDRLIKISLKPKE